MTATACSPVAGAPVPADPEAGPLGSAGPAGSAGSGSSAAGSDGAVHARTVFLVDPAEGVFPGHYPGFPIFPGVCIVECVRRSALATVPARDREWVLAGIVSTRFLSPVFPGDSLTLDLSWKRHGEGWRCSASVVSQRGPAAQVRLAFAERNSQWNSQ